MRIIFFKDGEVSIASGRGLGKVNGHQMLLHQLARLIIETSFNAKKISNVKVVAGKVADEVWDLDHVSDFLDEWTRPADTPKNEHEAGEEDTVIISDDELKEIMADDDEIEGWELVFESTPEKKFELLPSYLL